MRIVDISPPLTNGFPAYPGDPEVVIEPALLLEQGDGATVSRISMGDHSGTHLDAPGHQLPGGASLDTVPLSLLMGRALVADLRGATEIGVEQLEKLPLGGEERLLLKTDNSLLWNKPGFRPDYVALSVEGAEYLAGSGIRLLGIDYLSIEKFGGDGRVHRTLLENGIIILEGLDLSSACAGVYELICLPLRIAGGNGAPARAVLRER
jgi:arylformamidase